MRPQLGIRLFDVLAQEYAAGSCGRNAHTEFFRELDAAPSFGRVAKPWAARAVLVDMEPKVG
jgi:hypothetical protein